MTAAPGRNSASGRPNRDGKIKAQICGRVFLDMTLRDWVLLQIYLGHLPMPQGMEPLSLTFGNEAMTIVCNFSHADLCPPEPE